MLFSRYKEDLEREIRQLEPGKSLADELSEENTKREIEKLQYQLKEKEGMLTCTQEELASVKESLDSRATAEHITAGKRSGNSN